MKKNSILDKKTRKTLLTMIAISVIILGFYRRSSAVNFADEEMFLENDYIKEIESLNRYSDIGYEEYLYAKDGFNVLSSDDDYLYGTIKGNRLFKTENINGSRFLLQRFEDNIVSLEVLENGNILLCTTRGRWLEDAGSKIYLSKDKGKTFEVVLEMKTGDAFHWNYAHDDEGYVFISEYGRKDKQDNARRIYRSNDWGETFECIYEPKEEEGYHNHKIHIDKLDKNIIYQVVGDDNKRLLISRDRGDTWESIYWGDYHPTSLVDLGDSIVFGLDGAPYSGIVKFDKETMKISQKLRFKKPKRGGSVYAMTEYEDKLYAGFMSYGDSENWDGRIYTSDDDGENWGLLDGFDKIEETMGVGFHKFVEKGGKLYVNVQLPYESHDGSSKHYFGTLKIK